jgi:uncharacterized damage-inducible protein DinB
MNEILAEAFRYSAWATKALITASRHLSGEQLQQPARGFGSILATLNHVVLWDADYAITLMGAGPPWATESSETDDLDELEARVDETARLWERFVAEPADSERLLSLDAGDYECHASVVVVQAIHHANAHREQIRSSLRDLQIHVPDVQPWEYALAENRARWCKKK